MNNRICAIGVMWVYLAFLIAFFFGLAASVSIPFDSPALSLGHVAHYAGQTTIHSLLVAPLVLFVPASLVCVTWFFFVQGTWFRRGASVFAAALPVLFLDWSRLGVQVFALPLVAFYMPAQLLLGKADGEFWSESWPCYTLMGWWLIAWLIVIAVLKGNRVSDPQGDRGDISTSNN